ncbi:Bug family tripartite tricarboxylate transporter substrate binding protein [Limnohabitans sp.]|uniref:Bug family tripartite tricarboxylate transporter substrate binding protein n=1 Tax=Limnohabitans sp. TaxID=1907725 RepID=UPI0038BA77C8
MKKLFLPLLACLCLAPVVVPAQDWPSKPIRLIVPFPAGGPTDMVGREAANILREEFKQTVIVENRPGGNGTLGHAVLAKSPADGYTLGLLVITVAIAPHLGNAPFDTFKDFAPISNMVSMTPIVIANNQAPFSTLAELTRYAKANPDKLAYGTPGVGTVPHLAAELFQLQSGTKLNHVPYKGATQQIQDLIGGSTLLDFQSSLVVAMPQFKAERIKALAVLSDTRAAQLPNVPTAKESGYPELVVAPWFGLGAPAGTPAEIVHKVQAAIYKGLNTHDVQDRFAAIGASVHPNKSPAEFSAYIKSEHERWGKVIKAANVKAE